MKVLSDNISKKYSPLQYPNVTINSTKMEVIVILKDASLPGMVSNFFDVFEKFVFGVELVLLYTHISRY